VKQVVGVPGMAVSNDPDDVLITYALGSCLGITAHDPVARVGGLLHVMLPTSAGAPEKAEATPWMFVDTGVPRLFDECCRAGAQKGRLVVKVAGGAASQTEGEDHFQIGRRNFLALRQLLWRESVLLRAHDVGGNQSRTMALEIGTGLVTLKVDGRTFEL